MDTEKILTTEEQYKIYDDITARSLLEIINYFNEDSYIRVRSLNSRSMPDMYLFHMLGILNLIGLHFAFSNFFTWFKFHKAFKVCKWRPFQKVTFNVNNFSESVEIISEIYEHYYMEADMQRLMGGKVLGQVK